MSPRSGWSCKIKGPSAGGCHANTGFKRAPYGRPMPCDWQYYGHTKCNTFGVFHRVWHKGHYNDHIECNILLPAMFTELISEIPYKYMKYGWSSSYISFSDFTSTISNFTSAKWPCLKYFTVTTFKYCFILLYIVMENFKWLSTFSLKTFSWQLETENFSYMLNFESFSKYFDWMIWTRSVPKLTSRHNETYRSSDIGW